MTLVLIDSSETFVSSSTAKQFLSNDNVFEERVDENRAGMSNL